MTSDKPNLHALSPELILNQLSSALDTGIMVADLQGNILYRNSIFEQWVPTLIMENRLWIIQLLPFLNKEQQAALANVSPVNLLSLSTEKPVELETDHLNQKMFFSISYTPLFDKHNNLGGIIEITRNITGQKELEKSLQHARRFETVGRLASGIAHDFNNILQVINGHSEILLESHKENAKLTRSLEIVLASGQKASLLTRQLLLFSRRQQGEFKQVNLGEQINGMQKILTRMLGEDIIMTTGFNDKDIMVEGDISQLEQIIMNLAINARDAMPSGGKISISTEACDITDDDCRQNLYLKPGRYVLMRFADTGCGIPKDILEHIFEPFFTTKEAGVGTGLGLATVYSIIKQHQGYILVESTLNEGTVFKVYLPVSEASKTADETCAAFTPKTGCDKKVLIVEDDENVRALAATVLSNFGYCVQTAPDLKQANIMISKEKFDLLFIDIVLPDGDGVSFLESIQGENADSAFILSSGYTEDKPQIKNTISKGYTFLHKPFTIALLLQACSAALDNCRSASN